MWSDPSTSLVLRSGGNHSLLAFHYLYSYNNATHRFIVRSHRLGPIRSDYYWLIVSGHNWGKKVTIYVQTLSLTQTAIQWKLLCRSRKRTGVRWHSGVKNVAQHVFMEYKLIKVIFLITPSKEDFRSKFTSEGRYMILNLNPNFLCKRKYKHV